MCDISASNASVLPVRLLLTVGESNTCEKAVANARSQFSALALVLFVHRNVFYFILCFICNPETLVPRIIQFLSSLLFFWQRCVTCDHESVFLFLSFFLHQVKFQRKLALRETLRCFIDLCFYQAEFQRKLAPMRNATNSLRVNCFYDQ